MTFKPNNVIFFLLLLLSIMPFITVSGFGVPILYLLMPLEALLLLFIIFGWIKIPKVFKIIFTLFFMIVIEIFLSTLTGTITILGSFDFPTDIIQYIARFLMITLMCVVFYHEKVSTDTFIKYFLVILNFGMLIGVLQWVPWPGRAFFVSLYPNNNIEIALSHLSRELSGIRVSGLAQHATSNGGLATFFFVFGFSIFQYYKKYRFLSISLVILSVINIFASQSRAGILALGFTIILLYLVNVYLKKKIIKPTVYMLMAIYLIITFIKHLYDSGNAVIVRMVYRWNVLFESQGGARVDDLDYFLMLINTPYEYLFGLSKQVVNKSSVSHGVEIEAAYIFVAYGLIGFALHYALILFLLIYFFMNLKRSINNKAVLSLLIASFVGLAGYQVFSTGFFFFREINVGLFPWILIGVTIGVYERSRKNTELSGL